MLDSDGDPQEMMKACAMKWGEKTKEEKEALKTRDK